ncbi:MAG: winged helix-turn-helix domain-containing protein, partial [Candidatus Eremiobacteraeota bacterium]|nr:winged helix-turn-helix domain-containing protein [Candidatus Eremiobacteraeota bacterium]
MPQVEGSAASSRGSERVIQFGPFEFRPETQELFKNGTRVRVQAKPLQILRALTDKPGELVTRDELRRELWADGTFVDFESGLNTATNRLRAALSDSAEYPRYIETLPRLGYRFIYPVIERSSQNGTGVVAVASEAPVAVRPETSVDVAAPAPIPEQGLWRRIWEKRFYAVLGLIIFALGSGLAIYIRRNSSGPAQPVFRPLTYTPEVIEAARLLPGAKGAVFTILSGSEGLKTLSLKIGGPTASATLITSGWLASVSRTGDLAMLSGSKVTVVSPQQKPYVAGENVRGADWMPNRNEIAVVRKDGLEATVEMPTGHIVYRSSAGISDLRVSPDGKFAAFIEHPSRDDDGGRIRITDANGNTRELTGDWSSASGLTWTPSGREVWFTASKGGGVRSLYAVDMRGELRHVSNEPTSLRIFDIASDGRALISVEEIGATMIARFPGAHTETDLTQFDSSNVAAISDDGQRLLFTEAGDAGGQHYSTFLFDNTQHSSRYVGQGRGMALSADGRLALLLDPQDDTSLRLVPVDQGLPTRISGHGLHYQWARFLDKKGILAGGSYAKGPLMLFRQSLDGSPPTVLAGWPYVDYPAVSPDGGKLAGLYGKDVLVVDFCEKSVQPIQMDQAAIPAGWSADGKSIVLATLSRTRPQLLTYEVAAKSLRVWKELQVAPASFSGLSGAVAAPGADAYAYSLHHDFS